MEFKNKKLEDIYHSHKNKNNKDLSTILVTLKEDFEKTKEVAIEVAQLIGEIEFTYDKIYNELQTRLKFEETKK